VDLWWILSLGQVLATILTKLWPTAVSTANPHSQPLAGFAPSMLVVAVLRDLSD